MAKFKPELHLDLDISVASLNLSSISSDSTHSTGSILAPDIVAIIQKSDNDMNKPEDIENIAKLGEGAMGVVWKVRHTKKKTIMAKKRQLLRELSNLKTCNSPYIVSFYDAFLTEADTTIEILMEYCEGGSMEDIYKRAKKIKGVIGETILANVAESVCKGVIYLHSQKLIHRDIKPSNILMTRKGEIKLSDLGVSGELVNSMAETFTGSKYYMSPERIKGENYSVRSDIWSLGLTIIEVAQNKPALPPPGQGDLSIFELLKYILNEPIPTVGNDRSDHCRSFIADCLIKIPEERPTPEKMLKHPFIVLMANSGCDMETWLKHLWGWD
ncbi:kinase-like domain-containing protein [Pilobolus umbonatus]|nr:kinase-like domain-containing protein [Pilobolus umbonatus]